MEENDADYNTGERGERSYLEVGSLEEVRSKITINSYQLLELTHHEGSDAATQRNCTTACTS